MQVRLLLLLPLVAIFVTLHLLPYLPRPSRLFGLTVAPEVRGGAEGLRMLRDYQLRLIPWTIVAFVCSFFLPLTWAAVWVLCASVLPLIGAYLTFSQMRRRARQFALPVSSIRVVALKQTDNERSSQNWLFGVPIAGLCLCGLYLFARWDEMPDRFPIHWNGNGIADGWSNRTLPGVFGPLLIGLIVVLFLASQSGINSAASRKSARHPAVKVLMIAGSWVMACSFIMVALLPLHSFSPTEILWFDLLSFLVAATTAFLAMRQDRGGDTTSEISPDECWHGNLFYHNPQDPALLVEKRIGVGLTFNFGNRLSWVLAPLIVLLPAALVFLAFRFTVIH